MNTFDKLRRYIPALLRIPLGLIFLFFGFDKFIAPEATLAIIDGSMLAPVIPQINLMIYVIAIVEVIVGACLICNIEIRKTAVLAALLLINIIIIANVPQDVVLLFVALVLAILGNENPWKKSAKFSQ